jgi:signal transduction histidine kinase
METTTEVTLLTILVPLASVISIISVGVILLNQHFRKNLYKQKLEQEEIKIRHQQELLRSTIGAQEQERQRIANDLHDELGAMLSMARMQIKQLQKQPGSIANTSLENLREIVETSLASTKRICYQLMPPQLERYGLETSLEALAEQINAVEKTQAFITIGDNFPRFPNAIELGLYRIVSELANNTLKHSGATELNVYFSTSVDEITCKYRDNGIGIKAGASTKGLGMRSLHARAEALGGKFIVSDNDPGFNCIVHIPINLA